LESRQIALEIRVSNDTRSSVERKAATMNGCRAINKDAVRNVNGAIDERGGGANIRATTFESAAINKRGGIAREQSATVSLVAIGFTPVSVANDKIANTRGGRFAASKSNDRPRELVACIRSHNDGRATRSTLDDDIFASECAAATAPALAPQ
jgi:hypothetical protein